MENKVLVAAPTFEGMKYCQDRFIDRLKNLSYKNYDILLVDNTKTKENYEKLKKIPGINVIHDDTNEEKSVFRLISSRNLILKYALDNGYDNLLMFDADVIPPENMIEELLKWEKDIISGVYYNYFNISGKRKWLPVCWMLFNEEEYEEIKTLYPHLADKSREDLKRHITEEEVKKDELYEVSIPSAGCMMISKKVFEKINYGKYKKEGVTTIVGDDLYFIEQAYKQGFKSYCYPKMKCEHLVAEKYQKDENGNLVHSSFKDMI